MRNPRVLTKEVEGKRLIDLLVHEARNVVKENVPSSIGELEDLEEERMEKPID